MRNDTDVMVNLEPVEYMRKMILQSVTQRVLGVLGFLFSLWADCVTNWQMTLSKVLSRLNVRNHISVKNFFLLFVN